MHTFTILTAFLGGLVMAVCGAEQNTCTSTAIVSITTNVPAIAATSAVSPKTADSVLPTGLTNIPNDSEGMQSTGLPAVIPIPSSILASFGSGAQSIPTSLPTTLPIIGGGGHGPSLNITSLIPTRNATSVSTSIKFTSTKTSGSTTTTGSDAAATTSAPASAAAAATTVKGKEAVFALVVVAGVMFFL
ncbi:MAG: hypothetical protein Q9174_002680 [Haloplaca sp. 1 TL-2023]